MPVVDPLNQRVFYRIDAFVTKRFDRACTEPRAQCLLLITIQTVNGNLHRVDREQDVLGHGQSGQRLSFDTKEATRSGIGCVDGL